MKTNVAVFFGGRSVEHEISIISAVQAMRAINREKYDVTPIYVSKDGKEWGTPVAVHTFAGIESNQVIFDLQTARYVKITNINAYITDSLSELIESIIDSEPS